jgi:maltooligosyltrehalose synthase
MLGEQYGRVLENQEIQLVCQRGSFFVKYYETKLPIAPRASILILKPALERLGRQLDESHFDRLELESIITALEHLPPRTETDPEKVRERRREKEIVKRRLAALLTRSRPAAEALKHVIRAFNGTKGDPRSFDRLEELLAEQAYRLCYWRVAADEINYRRFFDVNELAAIRIEEPKVFAAMHELIFRLMREGAYLPLQLGGERARQVIAFARQRNGKTAIVMAGRFFTSPLNLSTLPAGQAVWRDTHLLLNEELAGCYRDEFTGGSVCARTGGVELPVAEAFAHLPFTLLERV